MLFEKIIRLRRCFKHYPSFRPLIYINNKPVTGITGTYPGDTKLLLEDIQELKPTIFPAVPRVLNKVYDKVNAGLDEKGFVVKVCLWPIIIPYYPIYVIPYNILWSLTIYIWNNCINSPLKFYHFFQQICFQNAFNYAVGCKVAEVESGIIRNDSVWDTLFFKKIQDKLGGRVKVSAVIYNTSENISLCFTLQISRWSWVVQLRCKITWSSGLERFLVLISWRAMDKLKLLLVPRVTFSVTLFQVGQLIN